MGSRGRNTRVEIFKWIFFSILSKSKLRLNCKIPLGFFPRDGAKWNPSNEWRLICLMIKVLIYWTSTVVCVLMRSRNEAFTPVWSFQQQQQQKREKNKRVSQKCWQFVFGCNNAWVKSPVFTSFTQEHLNTAAMGEMCSTHMLQFDCGRCNRGAATLKEWAGRAGHLAVLCSRHSSDLCFNT